VHEAKLNWVRANRLTGRPGQRFASLAEVARAAAGTNRLDCATRPSPASRFPTSAAQAWAKTPHWDSFNFSPSFRLYSTNDDQGNLTFRDTMTDVVQYQLPTKARR
jgi:hypothetical protein